MRRFAHVFAVDDAPFPRRHRGDVPLALVACAGTRLDGVRLGRVRRDGRNATSAIVDLVTASGFAAHTRLVMLEGITLAGFNVVDLETLHRELGLAVLVVTRHAPDLAAIRRALLGRVPGGRRKWALVEKAGPMEPAAGLWVQRAGLTLAEAEATIRALAVHGALPEPVRLAHLVAAPLAVGAGRPPPGPPAPCKRRVRDHIR